MIPALATTLIGASLLVGVWAAVAAVRERRVSGAQLVTAAAVEVLLLVQALLALVIWGGNARGVDGVTFAGYLLTSVLLIPVGAFWAIGERSRWGNGVLALTGVVVAVIVLRLRQVWGGGG
jgi:hypothetical protein